MDAVLDTIIWPPKRELFGVHVSHANYDDAERAIMAAAHRRVRAVVTHLPVHGLVTAARDAKYRRRVNCFELNGADGQPVRWALNLFHNAGLSERLYGPELMLRLCRRAAREGVPIYLYGSTPDVIAQLCRRLSEQCPGIQIVGREAPPFHALTVAEDEAVVQRIKQDHFAFEHKDRVQAVQLCVGAAFDFLAGTKRMAPAWMQKRGLEWAFRLVQEPGRLWRRYLSTNMVFVALVAWRVLTGR